MFSFIAYCFQLYPYIVRNHLSYKTLILSRRQSSSFNWTLKVSIVGDKQHIGTFNADEILLINIEAEKYIRKENNIF